MGNGMNKILPGLFLGNIIDAKDLDQLSKNNITHILSIHESPQPFIPGITYLRIVLPDTPEANIYPSDAYILQVTVITTALRGPALASKAARVGQRLSLEEVIKPRDEDRLFSETPTLEPDRGRFPPTSLGDRKPLFLCDLHPPDSMNPRKHFKESIRFIHSCRLRGGNCLVHCLAGISRSTTIVLAYLMAVTQLGWHEALEAVKTVRPVANPNLGFRQQLEEFGRSRSVQKIRRSLEHKQRGSSSFNDDETLRVLLPAGRRPNSSSQDRTLQPLPPKSHAGVKQEVDSFLLRVKQTFSCLPGCLK